MEIFIFTSLINAKETMYVCLSRIHVEGTEPI